jgi:hypothetical protein
MAERCQRFHAAVVSRQVRHASERWLNERADELRRLQSLLYQDPATAVHGLKRTADGCRWLIERWERLAQRLAENGYWGTDDRNEAIRLQGLRPDFEHLKHTLDAYLTRFFNLLCEPNPDETSIELLLHPDQMPDSLRAYYGPDRLPEGAKCRRMLEGMIQIQLPRLREAEQRLRTEIDLPDRAEAADRALMLENEAEARLFLRYQSESRSAFHRSYAQLLKTLDRGGASAHERSRPSAPMLEDQTATTDDGDATFPGSGINGEGEAPAEPGLAAPSCPGTAGASPSREDRQDPLTDPALNGQNHSPSLDAGHAESTRELEALADLAERWSDWEDSEKVSTVQVSSDRVKETVELSAGSTSSAVEELDPIAANGSMPATRECAPAASLSAACLPDVPPIDDDESPNEASLTPAAESVGLVEAVIVESPNEASSSQASDLVGSEGSHEVLGGLETSDAGENVDSGVEEEPVSAANGRREGALAGRVRDRARRARAAAAIESTRVDDAAKAPNDRADRSLEERLARRFVRAVSGAAPRRKAALSGEHALEGAS